MSATPPSLSLPILAPTMWQRCLAPILYPLSCLYAALMALRATAFQRAWLRQRRLPGRTIAIGNLEVGGTGKSPVTMAIARYLLDQGARPAILSRGYRSGLMKADSAALLGDKIIMPPQFSHQDFAADEARMQAMSLQQVPVIIGAKRWAAAQRFLREHTDSPVTHWLLDDGFQHLALARDIDLVLLRADAPLADKRVLPAGRLREHPAALRRASALLLTRSQPIFSHAALREAVGLPVSLPIRHVPFAQGALIQHFGPARQTPPRRVVLVLGIAHPDYVVSYLQGAGYEIVASLLKGDHETLTEAELQNLVKRPQVDGLITSAKDLARDRRPFQQLGVPIYELPIEASQDQGLWRDLLRTVIP